MASGCWIIRLQEADHPEQSLHEVDDLYHSLHDAGSSDFRKGMIWITHFMNRRNCFADHPASQSNPKNEVISPNMCRFCGQPVSNQGDRSSCKKTGLIKINFMRPVIKILISWDWSQKHNNQEKTDSITHNRLPNQRGW